MTSLIQSGLVDEKKTIPIIEIITQLLVEDTAVNVREECVKSMVKLCETHKHLILSVSIPKLIQQLTNDSTSNSKKDAADSLAALSLYEDIYAFLSEQLIPVLEAGLVQHNIMPSDTINFSLRFFNKVIRTTSHSSVITSSCSTLIPRIVAALIRRSFQPTLIHSQIIEDIVEIIKSTVNKLSVE